MERFHQANTEAQVLKARLKAHTAFEILFSVTLAVGGAIIGMAPYLAGSGKVPAEVVIAVGVAFILGGAVVFEVSAWDTAKPAE